MSTPSVDAVSPYYELIKPIPRTEKARLALEIVSDYARVRWLMAHADLPTAVETLRGQTPLTTDPRRQAVGKRLGRAVEKSLHVLPFDSRCLVRSLVLTSLLARRGISSTLVLGVDVRSGFAAHAWIESGGTALLAPLDDANRLAEL